MKRYLFLLLISFSALLSDAQTSASKHKIAIFVPLFLDAAFDTNNDYKYDKAVFPKFINPGLEFYEGARIALDSLGKEGAALDVIVYDTRSTKESLEEQMSSDVMRDAELIIAYGTVAELRSFAEAGYKRKIPVINVNVANDGGVNANPYFVILNSTLKTQCEGIYRYIQKYYATSTLVVFRKKGLVEDRIRSYFNDFSKLTVSTALKLKYVDLPDSFTVSQLRTQLDSNRQSLCIAGSLDEAFGRRLIAQLAIVKKHYPLIVMGMPTWDAIKDLNKPEYKGIDIVYSTPYYNAKTDRVSNSITNYFTTTMYARPSDVVFKGYEVTWKYTKLLMRYQKDLSSNLGNKEFKVFTDYDIQPVLNSTNTLDYFENKKLYFLKWLDGNVRSVSW